jgi:hypothetical protein
MGKFSDKGTGALVPQGRSGIGGYQEEDINKFPYEAFRPEKDTGEVRTLTLIDSWDFAVENDLVVGGDTTLGGDTNVQGSLDVDTNINCDGTLVVDGTSTLTGDVSIGSDLIIGSSGRLTVTTGTYNALDVNGTTFLILNGTGGDITINGFTGGVLGKVMFVFATGFTNTIKLSHVSASGTDQKIFVEGGADKTTTDYASWMLVCNGNVWRVS